MTDTNIETLIDKIDPLDDIDEESRALDEEESDREESLEDDEIDDPDDDESFNKRWFPD